MGNRSKEAQEQSTKMTQNFFEGVTQELDRQSRSGEKISKEMMEQTRKQQEAFQSLSQESANLYKEFLNSMLSYYQGGESKSGDSKS
jgi:pyrroloquinoline quinone (PQQ) biosynthesis protein C